jgi:peptidoglycan/xylan/chitin deacetylase (PgdA/CDA1 family)
VFAATAVALAACTGSPSSPPANRTSSAGPHVVAQKPKPIPTPATPLTAVQKVLAKLPVFAAAPAAVPIRIKAGSSAPIFYHLPVTSNVAFLTIDDGIVQMPEDLTVMRAAHIPFTMFLIAPVAARNPSFFNQLVTDGGVIEDHTLTHPILRGRSEAFQRHEICGARTTLTHTFGRAPVLFRPPFGDYDQTTLRLVHDCGLRAAFYWSETVRNGKVFYQTSDHRIKPGDILLMHFRSTFPADVLAALTAIHQAGLTPALLEDYIPAGSPARP